MYAWTFLLRVFSVLGAWKQPLESQDGVFEKMSFLIVIPTNTSPEVVMELSLIL